MADEKQCTLRLRVWLLWSLLSLWHLPRRASGLQYPISTASTSVHGLGVEHGEGFGRKCFHNSRPSRRMHVHMSRTEFSTTEYSCIGAVSMSASAWPLGICVCTCMWLVTQRARGSWCPVWNEGRKWETNAANATNPKFTALNSPPLIEPAE